MISAIELYGFLILTILGFILPIFAVLLSLFPNGIKSLYAKYENERKQSEENIISETGKKGSGSNIDYRALERTLKALKRNKYLAEIKLGYLRPHELVLRMAIPLTVAFMGVLIALQPLPFWYKVIALFLSVIAFVFGVRTLFTSISVLVEVSEVVNNAKRDTDERIVELLSNIVDKSGMSNLFLEGDAIMAWFNSTALKQDECFKFAVNKKYEIPFSTQNGSDVMAKKVEVGLIFTKDFLFDKTSNLSIYTDKKQQIIRFNCDIVHAHENRHQGRIGITFLKAGKYDIDTFIKGENVKYKRFSFVLEVIE